MEGNMESDETVKNKLGKLIKRNGINNFQHLIFIVFLLGLFYLYKVNYYLFHGTAEIFSCIIAVGILIISMGTYKFTNNNYFMLLGIGYMFVAAMDIFHITTYGDLYIFAELVYDADTRFWVAARGLELITFLLSFIVLFKPHKKINIYFVFLFYLSVTLFLLLDIIQFNSFVPVMRVKGLGLTDFKINFEYFIATSFVICCLILFYAKNKMDKSLFISLEISLILKILSELLFTMYSNVTDFYSMLGHIFKVSSYYSLYIGVIVNGLQRPFDMIKNNLYDADNDIKEKERQRKYVEEIISQNEQCYGWIIDNSSNGIVIARNSHIIYANATALRMVGAKDIYDVSGKEIKEFLFDNSLNFDEIKKISNSLKFNELKLLKLNKETIDVEYSINSVTYRGTPAYLILLKDMSLNIEINNLRYNLMKNKVELNKSNEYNKILTEFFSNISHELKTPINVILSAVQLLFFKKGNINSAEFMDQLDRLLGIIKQNCFRLIRLVNNLIDISKFESGFLKLELKNHNIVSIVENITLSVSDYIKSKDVNIVFDTNVEERLMAVDADKIERIILNLLSNAVKFTNKGDKILVHVEDNEDTVRISVKDSGVGIPEDKLNTVFDRFAQVEDTLIRNREGSGIGLSLVKSLTEMHGGCIKVKSMLGEGSEFIFELPVKLVDNVYDDETKDMLNNDSKIDKVLIEFSDIYSFD